MVDAEILQRYKSELDSGFKTMSLTLLVSHCNVKLCSSNGCHIQLLHDHIINALLIAVQRVIPFTNLQKETTNTVVLVGINMLHWNLIMLCIGIVFI